MKKFNSNSRGPEISKIQSLGSRVVSLLNEIVWGCQECIVFEVKIHARNLSYWKKVQGSKLTSFIWASAADKRKIFGQQIEIVNYQFNFKVAWLLYKKEILVHWRSSTFIGFLKTEKEFKTVPIFYSEIRVLQGKVSMHCPYNLSLFISFTFLPYRELWYSMCRSNSSMSYLHTMLLFAFFIFTCTFVNTLSLSSSEYFFIQCTYASGRSHDVSLVV